MQTRNKHIQLLETLVSHVYTCMQPSVYLYRARGNLSPRHLVLQAGNLLLQLTHCLLLLCCLCSQLHLQCDLTSLTNNTKGAKFQTPLSIIKYMCTTRSVMLLQYIHGKNDKAHFEMSS